MKRLHVLVMLLIACCWVLSGSVQAQTGPFCIGNLVWNDLNKNGIQDPGEPGIPDVTVQLYSCTYTGDISTSDLLTANGSNSLGETKTDLNGNYSFGSLPAGTYFVKVILPDDSWAISPMFQGTSDEKDSDIFPYLCQSGRIILSSTGQTPNDRLGMDAGLFQKQECDLISIGDMIFNDCNHNGVQDCEEKGIAGVKVELYACDILPIDVTRDIFDSHNRRHSCGIKIGETITDLDGKYQFTGVLPGQYCIKVELHHGFKGVFRPGCPDVCQLDEFNTTGCMTFNACTKNMDIDFAVCHENCDLPGIGDLVWNDANHDGLQTMGETGMKGIKATLYRGYDFCDGDKVGSVTTGDDGKYFFGNLYPGRYFVRFEVPYGFVPTNPYQLADRSVDSDVLDIKCQTGPDADDTVHYFTTNVLDVDEVDLTIDAGFWKNPNLFATVDGRVWRDDDLDGIQDGILFQREPGMANVTVELYTCSCTCSNTAIHIHDADHKYGCKLSNLKLVATTKTDENGYYEFKDIKPSRYSLKVVPPPCYALTKYLVGTDDYINSDVDPASKFTHCLTLKGGDYIEGIDGGLIPSNSEPGMVGDFVWEDANKNGVQDCGEKGIGGVTVELHACDGGCTVATTKTDANGKYLFTNVPTEATYYVKFILPGQYKFTVQNADANDALDSDPCPELGRTDDFTLTSGLSTMIIDAGMYRCNCTVSNIVYNDANKNGKQDADEKGVMGAVVELYSCASKALVQSATTDAEGRFTFNNILADSYNLNVVPPSGYVKAVVNGVADDGCCNLTGDATSIGEPIALVVDPTSGVESRMGVPTAFELKQNFPNPFNPATTIYYDIPTAGQYMMKVYNMLGQEVATLINGELSAGYHQVTFDASKLTSGVYIYRLTGNNVVMTKKMMLNK